tara:strand:+ start:5287 stop:5607 length:321 start_codon:yes stop_codon:yes gene_type:complete
MENKIIKEKPKFIGSNSFKFWLEVDKIRKANTRKDLSIIKRFKNSENEQEEIYNFYELRDWIVNSLKKEKTDKLIIADNKFKKDTDGIAVYIAKQNKKGFTKKGDY